ncbi:hypothetical protein [Prauserella cavernicola]|uniref:WXG100 family type VII secretion target n=1 Tax=Prauserella cavernicola TaxID=2800127 RepID=A0A934QPL3_9PSEU|nr:hypothetical protein [Prauserella cavernicola]MBK1784050.1 hypothetical protein [Prauserella cavernicola]
MADVRDATKGVEVEVSDDSGFINTGNIPGALPGPISGGVGLVSSLVEGPGKDPDVGDVANHAASLLNDTVGFVQSIGGTAMEIASDPLGWLIGQGLDFLLAVIQPLQDALHAVTGDGPALEEAAGNFGSIGDGFQAMSDDFVRVADEALSGWSGEASEAAKAALANFADGVSGVAAKSGNVAEILQASSMLMTVVEEVLKAIITEFVKWLIMIWVPALAAAIPTAGASTAAAGTATTTQATTTVSSTTQKVNKLTELLNKIKAWFAELQQTFAKGGIMEAARKSVTDAAGDAGMHAGQSMGRKIAIAGKESLTSGAKEAVNQVTGLDPSKEGGELAQGYVKHQLDQSANADKIADYDEIGTEQSDAETRRDLDV